MDDRFVGSNCRAVTYGYECIATMQAEYIDMVKSVKKVRDAPQTDAFSFVGATAFFFSLGGECDYTIFLTKNVESIHSTKTLTHIHTNTEEIYRLLLTTFELPNENGMEFQIVVPFRFALFETFA